MLSDNFNFSKNKYMKQLKNYMKQLKIKQNYIIKKQKLSVM